MIIPTYVTIYNFLYKILLQPNDFYKILLEAMSLAKEYVIRDERRETALVDNETARNEFQQLLHKCFWNFSQVCYYELNHQVQLL